MFDIYKGFHSLFTIIALNLNHYTHTNKICTRPTLWAHVYMIETDVRTNRRMDENGAGRGWRALHLDCL